MRETERRNSEPVRHPSAKEPRLGLNASELLGDRYLRRDERGQLAETPDQMFRRVAEHVASAEFRFGGDRAKLSRQFGEMMRGGQFLPNSPTLMNAGLSLGQLSACFVIPVEDSLGGIFDALKEMAIIHQSGGGTGFSFSRLRPRGDAVRSTGGVASGPVSFMGIFDAATEVVRQGGCRRGANMAVLRGDHPDIREFVHAKDRPGQLENFNTSAGVTDEFMHRALFGGDIELVNPRTGKVVETASASDLLGEIAASAWQRGDPGILFLDRINRAHPLPGIIEATNPCGEQPLLPHESCNLGSVNLSKFVENKEIDWDRLGETVALGVRFLDNVIEVNHFPLTKMREATLKARKIGLGVMGFAEMLIKIEVSYNSKEALQVAEEVMSFVSCEAREMSRRLGRERGSFPLFERSSLEGDAMRNATTTTIAPTGSISIIAGTSPGIEPLFAVSFARNLLGKKVVMTSPLFEKVAREQGVYSESLMKEIARKGRIGDVGGVPRGLKDLFVTALEVSPEQHVRIQAAFQKHTDNGVSKTVNLPTEATIEDVLEVFHSAYRQGCKGITVYRYGCREQVLYLGEGEHGAPEGCRVLRAGHPIKLNTGSSI
ncbi:MAG: adenosylcobalamin-dependent ribonucleoside-diphosphate reductase [Euryarchaeota archaeon]|nr:adenosylcobalamin-dependent ribonucleoside-diphosphate reductase [Euryarchaeota archaeon]